MTAKIIRFPVERARPTGVRTLEDLKRELAARVVAKYHESYGVSPCMTILPGGKIEKRPGSGLIPFCDDLDDGPQGDAS